MLPYLNRATASATKSEAMLREQNPGPQELGLSFRQMIVDMKSLKLCRSCVVHNSEP